MGLDAKGRRIVECGMEIMEIKERLFDLSREDLTLAQQEQRVRLERAKHDLLAEVSSISTGAADRSLRSD